MIELMDGPAKGTLLSLARAPRFLRVVVDTAGKVDAMDQVDDEPKDGETIHVYRREGEVTSGFACTRGKGCRPLLGAAYRLVDPQPEGDELAALRQTSRWQLWCLRQVKPGDILHD